MLGVLILLQCLFCDNDWLTVYVKKIMVLNYYHIYIPCYLYGTLH